MWSENPSYCIDYYHYYNYYYHNVCTYTGVGVSARLPLLRLDNGVNSVLGGGRGRLLVEPPPETSIDISEYNQSRENIFDIKVRAVNLSFPT